MITPRFSLTQDSVSLTINIRAPYCNLKELDVCVDKSDFLFACKPYYLRLNLPGNIRENDTTKSSFDSSSGEFSFTYEKENEEEFPNLDFITTFLQPKTVEIDEGGRKIELLTSEVEPIEINNDNSDKYGFALRGGYTFQNLNGEFTDIFSIDPFETKFEKRKEKRISNEKEKFDADHYIADLMDDSQIIEICKLACPWENLHKEDIGFTEKEFDFLKDLPNINYNLTSQQVNYCYNSLIDIFFAYCYDRRTTFYEGTCESGWTISTISASLSCFDSFLHPKEAIISAFRRSLIFPLYRSFRLCERVFEDLKLLLRMDIKYLIKCLINMHDIFLHSDSRYILNKLFIDDYITYIMKCDISSWTETVEIITKMAINKSELGLNLLDIERSIGDVELSNALENLNVGNTSEDSDDFSSSSSDSESDSSDSESDSSDNESESSSETDRDDKAKNRDIFVLENN